MTLMEMRGAFRGQAPSMIDGREGSSYEHKFSQASSSPTEVTMELAKREDLTPEDRHAEAVRVIEPWSSELAGSVIENEREIDAPPAS